MSQHLVFLNHVLQGLHVFVLVLEASLAYSDTKTDGRWKLADLNSSSSDWNVGWNLLPQEGFHNFSFVIKFPHAWVLSQPTFHNLGITTQYPQLISLHDWFCNSISSIEIFLNFISMRPFPQLQIVDCRYVSPLFQNWIPQFSSRNFLLRNSYELSISCGILSDLRSKIKCESHLNVVNLHFSLAEFIYNRQSFEIHRLQFRL